MLIIFFLGATDSRYPWIGGVDVFNAGSPLFVCACMVGTSVCVLHAGCLNAW